MANPALNDEAIEAIAKGSEELSLRTMSVTGVIGKTLILFTLLLFTGTIAFECISRGLIDKAYMMMQVGFFGALITGFFVALRPHSRFMILGTMIYAMLEGLLVGGATGAFASAYGGALIIDAILATFASLFATLFLYRTGIIKPTERFKSTITAATFGVCIIYLFSYITSFFTPAVLNVVFGGGIFAFGLNIIICVVAVLNFIIDFDTIENGVRYNLPDRFEWYCGFGLFVTLIWVYIEFLRLLARFQRR